MIYLLDRHRQIHIGVNGAIQLESTSRSERSDLMGIIALKLLLNGWRAVLLGGFSGPIIPGAILDNMGRRRIVNHIDTTAFCDSDRRLNKVRVA